MSGARLVLAFLVLTALAAALRGCWAEYSRMAEVQRRARESGKAAERIRQWDRDEMRKWEKERGRLR